MWHAGCRRRIQLEALLRPARRRLAIAALKISAQLGHGLCTYGPLTRSRPRRRERMASSNGAGLASAATAALFILASAAVPVAAQTNQQVTICQATGSQANPWVFTTIDARDLAEHLARGDFRANSIADCPGAKPGSSPTPAAVVTATVAPATSGSTSAPAVTATVAPATGFTPARAGTPSGVQQQGVVGGGLPVSDVSASQPVNAATATPPGSPTVPPVRNPTSAPANATPEPEVNVAGAQATPELPVSTLPKSGGEPDRPLLALGLLGLIIAGVGLRRVGRFRRRA